MAGTIQLNVKGEKGTVLRIKHAEMFHKDGSLNLSNLDYFHSPSGDMDPFQVDIVTLSGKDDSFTPKFNYKGFQYVEVLSSQPISLACENIHALEMHSDVPFVGSINSSNGIINKIHEACRRSYLANLYGYPTDCPQREKNGWTGDAHIAIETGLYNFDVITIYEKWLQDFQDVQQPNGQFPAIIPAYDYYDWGNGVDWTSAVAIIPWEIYKFYGDSRLLEKMYDNIKRYVDYITSISDDGLTNWGLGDWLPIEVVSDSRLTSSLYYYGDVVILAKAARLFGKIEDLHTYETLAEKIRSSINRTFLMKKKQFMLRALKRN